MKRWLVAVFAVALVACVARADRRQILQRNEMLFHAIAARDVATLDRLIAPDFHFRSADGQAGDRRVWLAGVAAIPVTIESITNDDLTLALDGDHALLCGVQHARVVVDGKSIADQSAFCDRWEKRDGVWLGVFAGTPPAAK